MEIRRTIPTSEWTESMKQKAEEYWRVRGFKVNRLNDGSIKGERGSLWGNLNSFHITKIMTSVTIVPANAELNCMIDINTRFRGFTAQNRKYLDLELATFESYLLTGDLQTQAWADYRRDAAKEAAKLTGMALRHTYTRRGPVVLGGDLKMKARMMWVFAVVAPLLIFQWGHHLITLVGGITGGRKHHTPEAVTQLIFGPVLAVMMMAVFAGMAVWITQMQRDSAKCVTADDAAEQLGLNSDHLRSSLEERSVKPRFILNGEPVFDMDDITGAAILLRPASESTSDALLIPASSSASDVEVRILRPATPSNNVPEQVQETQMTNH